MYDNVHTYKNARNELAHLVMGTIFLVIFSVCEVYRDGGYLQVVEECARQSIACSASFSLKSYGDKLVATGQQ